MQNFLQKLFAPIGTSPMLKTMLSVFAYAVVPIAGVLFSILAPSNGIFREFGSWAEAGLVVILFLKPVACILPFAFLKRALTYRRQMGVATFWLALFHSVGLMYLYGLWSPGEFLGLSNMLLYGGVAMIMLIFLGVTSNNVSVRFLKGNWKRIQYLAYPTLFLVLLHASLFEGSLGKFLFVGGVFVALKWLEVKKFRLEVFIPAIGKWGV